MIWTGTTGENGRPRSDGPYSQPPNPSASTADSTTLSCFGQQWIGAENPLRQVIVNTHSPGVVGQVRDEDLLIAQHREYSRDKKRYKALVLRALPGTWRVTKGQAPVASRGALLSYLSPFQPRQSDSRSRGRVIDRKDLRQLMLPGLGVAS